MRVLSLLCAAFAAGCLSSPTPSQVVSDAAPNDAPVVDGPVIDAPAVDAAGGDGGSCKPGPTNAGTAFPPAGISVRTAIRADVNGDCVDDTLVAVASAVDAEQGVYVLLGRANADGSRSDAFLNTGAFEPRALAAHDLDGDGFGDVLALGGDDSHDAALTLFMATGAGTYAAGVDLALGGPSLDPGTRTYLAIGNLDGDSAFDVLIGRYLTVQYVDLEALDNGFQLLSVRSLPEPNFEGWADSVTGRMIAGGVANRDDILVVKQNFTYRYPNDGGAPDPAWDREFFNNGGDYDAQPGVLPGLRSVFIDDLNGDDFPDLIGNGDNDVRLVLLDPTRTIEPYLFQLNDDLFIDIADNLIDFIRLVPVDDQTIPALLMANDLSGAAASSTVTLFIGARLQAGTPRWAATFKQKLTLPADFHPAAFVTGDFDGDGITNAIAFDDDGSPYCVDVRAGDGLTACAP